jgi:hypothetical protein
MKICIHVCALLIVTPALAENPAYYSNHATPVSPLTDADLKNEGGGATCEAHSNGKRVFYDDGQALIRFHGHLLRMAPHDQMPAAVYTAADSAASMQVFFTKRPGRIVRSMEGSKSPMTMRLKSKVFGTEVVNVFMSCGA